MVPLLLLKAMRAQQELMQAEQCPCDWSAQLQRTPAAMLAQWGTRWKAILLCQPGTGKAQGAIVSAPNSK